MAFVTTNHSALGGVFRVKINSRRELRRSKQRIEHRLRDRDWAPQDQPMLTGKNIHYEMSSRDRAIPAGGIGAMQLMAQRLGLAKEIDEKLPLLKVHLPYLESDHVLNSPTTRSPAGPASRTSSCCATARATSIRSARNASPIQRPPETYRRLPFPIRLFED